MAKIPLYNTISCANLKLSLLSSSVILDSHSNVSKYIENLSAKGNTYLMDSTSEWISDFFSCIFALKYVQADTNYIQADTNYIQADTNYIQADSNYIQADTNYIQADTNYIQADTNWPECNIYTRTLRLCRV
jgi:hypothetical protein